MLTRERIEEWAVALILDYVDDSDNALELRALCDLALRGLEAQEFVESLRRTKHDECDDSWYSCPKSEEGCANEDARDECTCGTDFFNAKLDKFLLPQTPEVKP